VPSNRRCHIVVTTHPQLLAATVRLPGSPTTGSTIASRLPQFVDRGRANNSTGLPNKYYRGFHQTQCGHHTIPGVKTSCKSRETCVSCRPSAPTRRLPGRATSTTGFPDKKYRVSQQGVPGCLTKSTGARNKYYRGFRQEIPGSLTSPPKKMPAKAAFTIF
jgi:hypothetical protein